MALKAAHLPFGPGHSPEMESSEHRGRGGGLGLAQGHPVGSRTQDGVSTGGGDSLEDPHIHHLSVCNSGNWLERLL